MTDDLIYKLLRKYPNLPNPKHEPKMFEHYLKIFMRDEGLGKTRKPNIDIKV